MARLSDVNPWRCDPEERKMTVLRVAADSSRCEGIEISEQELELFYGSGGIAAHGRSLAGPQAKAWGACAG